MGNQIDNKDDILLSPDYRPTQDEDYMNSKQLAYFKKKLKEWRDSILHETADTIHALQEESHDEPDINDRASTETERSLELRTRDRERKLLSKIDEALMRIQNGEYGYCEETGDPIGLARLEARPIATLSLEAQELHERKERTQKDHRS